jgi:Cu/Ag efflux pump CusA
VLPIPGAVGELAACWGLVPLAPPFPVAELACVPPSGAVSMPTDIFPYIDIPIASVVWTYSGMSPREMADRVVTRCERAMTTTVNDIEHMESSSYNGVAVMKVYFHR